MNPNIWDFVGTLGTTLNYSITIPPIEIFKDVPMTHKWLKAGILEEDSKVILPVTGTPQGGVVSAVLANIYLHFVLDLWIEKVIKPSCDGDVMLMRYADDYVCCFQYHRDLQELRRDIDGRLRKFNLELSKEKTRVIEFTRFETEKSETFTFLGFEYRWGLSRQNKPLVKMRTAKKKFKVALAAMGSWIKAERCKLGTAMIMEKLRAKLQGHYINRPIIELTLSCILCGFVLEI
jgi:RNA-directed DNA polymerase